MNEVKLDFDDLLMVPRFSRVNSRSEVVVETVISGGHGRSIVGVPIIAANMRGVGTFDMAKALSKHGLFTAIEKSTSRYDWVEFCQTAKDSVMDKTFVTVGMGENDLQKLEMFVERQYFRQLKIVIDVANGYMDSFYEHVSEVRNIAPDSFILAGTVCTPDAVERLIGAGADLARVGIGSGAVCTTRQVAGVGYPQASAIIESNNLPIVCDGGCTHPADFAKAFALGADMVMAGGVFAGHTEGMQAPDENGMIQFFGMSSHAAQDLNNTRTDYRSSEGRVVKIPYRGDVKNTVEHILGGIRSACAYTNCKSIYELQTNPPEFIRVNNVLNRSLEKYTI